MQKAVCEMEAIPKLVSIISQMDEEDNVYGIVGQKDKLKEVCGLYLSRLLDDPDMFVGVPLSNDAAEPLLKST